MLPNIFWQGWIKFSQNDILRPPSGIGDILCTVSTTVQDTAPPICKKKKTSLENSLGICPTVMRPILYLR